MSKCAGLRLSPATLARYADLSPNYRYRTEDLCRCFVEGIKAIQLNIVSQRCCGRSRPECLDQLADPCHNLTAEGGPPSSANAFFHALHPTEPISKGIANGRCGAWAGIAAGDTEGPLWVVLSRLIVAPRMTVHGRKAVNLVARWPMAAFHRRPEERHISREAATWRPS